MFEKYGIIDLFCGVRRWIAGVLVLFFIGFLVGSCKDYLISKEPEPVDLRPSYSSTQVFYFTYNDLGLAAEQGIDYIKMINSSVNIYMRSAFVDEYVMNYIKDNYGEDYLYEHLHINDEKVTSTSYSPEYLNTFTSSTVLGDGMSVNFSVSSKNKELTEVLFEGFMSYLDELGRTTYKDLKLVRFQTYEGQSLADAAPIKQEFNLKQGILFGCVGIMAGVMVIFLYTLFVPRMNRKSDFVNYEVDILGEIQERNIKDEIVSQQYLRIVNKLDESRVITLTSSMQDEKCVRQVYNKMREKFTERFEFLEYDGNELDYNKWITANIKEGKRYFILIPSVILYETALQVAKNSDAMILAEKYGRTLYKDFERVIELVNSSKIHLKGIIGLN